MAQVGGISFKIKVGGPAIAISQPPDFIYPAELGFGVAVGVPYDMFYNNGICYVFRGGGWYQTSAYGGSWIKVRHRELPPELRRSRKSKNSATVNIVSIQKIGVTTKRFTPVSEVREERYDMKAAPPVRNGRKYVSSAMMSVAVNAEKKGVNDRLLSAGKLL